MQIIYKKTNIHTLGWGLNAFWIERVHNLSCLETLDWITWTHLTLSSHFKSYMGVTNSEAPKASLKLSATIHPIPHPQKPHPMDSPHSLSPSLCSWGSYTEEGLIWDIFQILLVEKGMLFPMQTMLFKVARFYITNCEHVCACFYDSP